MTKAKKYGIGEWYGKLFKNLPVEERKELAVLAQRVVKGVPQKCPFRCLPGHDFLCNKKGGVCSLVLYERTENGEVLISPGANLVTTCPNRFFQNELIFHEIGKELLNDDRPLILNEFSFLVENSVDIDANRDTVGKIDTILLAEKAGEIIAWSALEMQAVYFSGDAMNPEFKLLTLDQGVLPFPVGQRRPDFRSSGPKRLMPQLQIKIPTLRRWGKKMAVVVDEEFFHSLGTMNQVNHVSNADIIWFVVNFDMSLSPAQIYLSTKYYTTLEYAVEGLTGGVPIPLPDFEQQIRKKLTKIKK